MSYTLDLSKIFVDVNGDELTYQVSVNGAKAAAAAPTIPTPPMRRQRDAGVYRERRRAHERARIP